MGSPPYLLNPQIIGAEDDYFDSQQEQVLYKNNYVPIGQKVDWMKHNLHEHLNKKKKNGNNKHVPLNE